MCLSSGGVAYQRVTKDRGWSEDGPTLTGVRIHLMVLETPLKHGNSAEIGVSQSFIYYCCWSRQGCDESREVAIGL